MSTRPVLHKRPVVLCIMDGWGHREDSRNNAVQLAQTPVIDHLDSTVPKSFLDACGPAVGLPEGQVGNSEVGHMTIGAGRIIPQDLTRIDAACTDGTSAVCPSSAPLPPACWTVAALPICMGLISPGGVHSRDEHILTLARTLTGQGIPTAIHAFTDGRDTRRCWPRKRCLPSGSPARRAFLATVCGRYFAMDRDHRWHRTERAWRLIACAESDHSASDGAAAVAYARQDGRGDEFILPTVISGYMGMRDGDAVIMANFRADRVRQLLAGFCLENAGFDTSQRPALLPPSGLFPIQINLIRSWQQCLPNLTFRTRSVKLSPVPAAPSCALPRLKVPPCNLFPERW